MAVDEREVIFAICSRGRGQPSFREKDNQELKVEAYRVLTSHLKQSGSKFLPQLLDRFQEIIPLTLNDAGAASEELSLAALQFLGYCLFDQPLADISQAEVIVPVLCELALRQQASDEVITRLLWCLANHKMSCSPSLLTSHVKVQVMMISQLIMSQKHSTSVEAECLNLLHRMYKDHETIFVKLDPTMWYPSLVTMLTGEHKQNVTAAYQLAKKLQPLLVSNHDVACSLVDCLKEKLASSLHKQFTNMKIEQTTLLVWQHFVCVLDKQLHNYGNWFNSFLKTVEQAFKHMDSEVQISAYKAWRCLIDNYALNLRILTGSRRMKLIMTPLVGFPAQARHEEVDVERLITWQHLIGHLSNKRTQCVKQVITPLLLFSVGIDSRLSSVVMDEWALDGAHLYITPAMSTPQSSTKNITKVSINLVSHHGDDISVISSPRIHPGIVYHSVLLSCCQLVMSLCGYPPANQITGAVVPVIKCGDGKSVFMKQPRTFLLFMEAILQLSPIVNDEVCHGVWQAIFRNVTAALTDPAILSVSPLVSPLMRILRIALRTKKFQQLTVLMVTELCYLYHQIPFKLSSEQMLVVSSLSDKTMFPWQFLLETILHYAIILQKIQMVTVVTVFKFSFADSKDFINNASSIVDLLIQSMPPSNKEHRWLLFEVWYNLISTITDKIVKVSKLCEGNSNEHYLSLSCELLIYPIKLLYASVTVASSVPIEVRAKLIPTWTKLLETAAMVITPESTNDLVTMVIDKLVDFLQEKEAEIYMLCALTKICSSSVTHTNYAKGDPSRIVNVQLKLLQWVLVKTSQSQELLQEAMTTSLFTGLTDLVARIFATLKGTDLVIAGLNHVIPHLTSLFNNLHNRFDRDHSTLYMSLRKVWSAIATCIQACYTGSYSSELLAVLSPLLVLMLSLRDRGRHNNSLCSQMLTFWCATFAKEASLVYPEELCDALRQFRLMGGRIELPGWPEGDKNVTVVADSLNGHIEEELLELTESPLQTSSCLHKTLPNIDSRKGKKHLRARRKLPLDCYNSENMEVNAVTKKKRLLSRYHKDHCRERQRSHDASQLYKQLSSQLGSDQDLSIDEMSQSDESPAIPVPVVIACEADHDNSDGVDIINDISSPSLLFDSNTPVSMLSVTKPQFSVSNSQAISMATEQDSVSTIPDTVETGEDDEHVITMVTNPSFSDSEQVDDADSISVVDSSDAIGEIPTNDNDVRVHPEGDSSSSSVSSSNSHLLDHSYAILHDEVGGANLYEKLKCLDKVATMITPMPKKSSVLLKDNGCHAARCSAIKRSNRTLARVRRHQRQITSLSPKKPQGKKMDTLVLSKHTSLPVEGIKIVDVAEGLSSAGSDGDDSMMDSVTLSVAKVNVEGPEKAVTQPVVTVTQSVTQPVVTVTQPMVTVTCPTSIVTQPVVMATQSKSTVTQPMVMVTCPTSTVTQPVVTMTQPIVMATQSKSTVTQPMVMVTCPTSTVTQPVVTMTQPIVTQRELPLDLFSQDGEDKLSQCNVVLLAKTGGTTHRKDSMAQSVDVVTHQTDTVAQSLDMVTNRTNTVTQSVDMVTHRTDTVTQPMDMVTHRIDTVTQPMDTVTHQTDTVTQSVDMVTHRTDAVTQYTTAQKTSDTVTQHISSTSSDQYNITIPLQQSVLFPNLPPLQQCLINQLAINNLSTALHGIHGNNHLPCVPQSLKGSSSIVAKDAASKMACLYGMLSSCLVSSETAIPISGHHSITTSSMTHHMAASSQILPIIHNVFSNVNTNQLPFSNRRLPNIIRNRQLPIVNAQGIATTITPTCSDLIPTSTLSVMSVNTTSVTSLTSSINAPVTSVMSSGLQSVNVPSVTSLTSVNSSVTPLTSNPPIITSLTSVNTLSVTSLTSVNAPVSVMSSGLQSVNSSVMPLTSNPPIITSLTSVSTPSVTSLTSVKSASVTSSPNSSAMSLAKVNSQSFQPIQIAQFPNITVSMSVNSSITPVTSNALKSVSSPSSLTSINTATITSLTSASISSVSTPSTNSSSNKCSSLTLKQAEDIETSPPISNTSNSITSVTIGTISQATASENMSCSSKPGDNMESPPHTPTGGILKRVSQFDTPTTSGKRRRVSFADTVGHDDYTDVCSDRRYVTSPRSKLHSKVSPRRLLSKSDKANNGGLAGKTKSLTLTSNVENSCSLPTYPALSSCDVPVDAVLPDLISSPMARSLGKLFHARDIRTVGHLASLPENQVKSLPIQQPKLKTLRNTLESFEKQLEQTSSKVAISDKSLSLSKVQPLEVPTEMESSDHVITTSAHDHGVVTDHVSSDDVTVISTSDKQISLAETVDQPATSPKTNDANLSSSCAITGDSITITAAGDNVEQPSDTPTSMSGPLPISDRMQYLTESCSYDNSNDSLILATPESQCVMQDEQVSCLATTNDNTEANEDPLVITPTDEGNSLQDDEIAGNSSIPQARTTLHNHLQAIAAKKFPQLLTELNSFLKFIKDRHLDEENLQLATSIIVDALDYEVLASRSP